MDLVDLASERLGGAVLFANDDFFAPKENLLKVEPAVFLPEKYTDRGKWMDGWESRRRRTPGHDFCVIRLGLPGVVRGLDVDTSHFKGNYPEAFSLDGGEAAEGPWRELVPRTPLRGDSHNLVPVSSSRRVTHLRLHIYPDGGVARLRVYGDVAAGARLASESGLVDLAALENGGLVVASSDAFFGSHQNLLMPGRASSMKEGWETKRSRRPGFDWVVLRLGARGKAERVEIDTNHFKGNYPDRASVEVCDAPGAEADALLDPARAWHPLVRETKLQAHTRHFFSSLSEGTRAAPLPPDGVASGPLLPASPATHVRLRIYPDGGVSRLRVFCRPHLPEPLAALDAALEDARREEALATLRACCGSSRWAAAVADERPFGSHLELFAASDRAFETLSPDDWREAFAAHPRLGDREGLAARFASTKDWAEGEQAGALAAPESVLDALAASNAEYESRFGHVFLLCATGLSAETMLASLRDRLGNPADVELSIAAEEQRRITRLRLGKLLSEAS